MHKRLSARVVAAAAIFIIASLGISQAHADITSPWIISTLSLQKQADTLSLPSSLYGNIDCEIESASNCSVPAAYGAATSNSTVRLNNEGTSLDDKGGFVPVYTYLENRQRFFPIPNSSTAVSYTSGPVYGLHLYFNYNFSASITRTGGAGSLLPAEYHINRPPDGKLADKSNHLLPADISSISFSQNGQWLVVSDPNVAMLRVNLQTFDVLPFGPGFNYSIGLDPAIKTAITNDGRYAITASNDFSTVRVYDLNSCGAVPNAISGPVACQSRDLQTFLRSQVPGYSFVSSLRFTDDDTLAAYITYKANSINKTARYIISNTTITSQLDYLALGDSYISGEGAFDYAGGTDTASNRCHLSYLSYPFLLGHELNYNSYHSVACSGATTNDITNVKPEYKGQADGKKITRKERDENNQTELYIGGFLPGYIDQLDFVYRYQPKSITVSVGGNDVNMIGKLKSCVKPGTCYTTYEDRLEFVHDVNSHFDDIVDTYNAIKKAGPPDMRVYAIGYPQIAKPDGDCALNVHLNNDEVLFADQAVDYLDTVIKTAAAKAGVFYVDAENALYSHRLCEAGPGSVAMNGVTAGNDIPERLGGPIGSESFHPNPFGHQLLENKILASTHNLTEPMPEPNPSAVLPPQASLEILDAPHSDRQINTVEYDSNIAPDLAYQQTLADISIEGEAHSLAPGTVLQAELHSDVTTLGNFTADSIGNLSAQIEIPSSAPGGYHTLHFYGTDINGQPIDIYKDIYIAHTADDLDGNGLADSLQKCVGVDPSGQDFDQDGIDDSCDGMIAQPPTPMPDQPAVNFSGSVSSSGSGLIVVSSSSTTSNRGNDSNPQTAVSAGTSTPKVLGANTNSQPKNAEIKNNLKIPARYYLIAGIGFLSLVTSSYGLKNWLF